MSTRGYKLFRWTGAHRKWVSENMHLTDQQMAEHIGVNVSRVQAFRKRMGLIKDHCGHFTKGNEPHNKGKAAPWANEKCASTQFRKGHRPHNANKPGTIRKEYHKGKPRLMICVEGGRAKPYARWLWVSLNGPVPDGHFVRTINGKWDDIREDNLMCVTRAENARMNRSKIDVKARGAKIWRARRLNAAKMASEPYQIAA